MLVRTLIVAEPPTLRLRLGRLADQPDVLLTVASRPEGLWEGLARESYDLVIVAVPPGREPTAELVSAVRRLPDHPEVVVLQADDDSAERASLLAAGSLAVIPTDLSDEMLGQTLRALVIRRRESLLRRWRSEAGVAQTRLSDFASISPGMERLLSMAYRVAQADSSLLILGETGVGKEWLARAIHSEGRRSAAPFIAVNCAAVPDSLLESELFGHEKGAFTGAVRSRRGFFELAHRGTIFLDEIADMSPHLQAKLLRVLQERKIQRVGAESSLEIDVRIMAATNRELEREMSLGSFRRDLFYRLSVVMLTIPPLRERREDITLLVDAHLEQLRQQLRRTVMTVAPQALEALTAYSWPGNVRELINVLERGMLLSQGTQITPADLPESIQRSVGAGSAPASSWLAPRQPGPNPSPWADRTLKAVRNEMLDGLEREYFTAQLRHTGGRIGETARRAGISERALYTKMRRLGLRKEDYR